MCENNFIEHGLPLCKNCFSDSVGFQEKGRCKKCGELLYNSSCSVCSSRKIYFNKAFFLYNYKNREKHIFKMAKFENRHRAVNFFTENFLNYLKQLLPQNINYILALPSSKPFLEKLLSFVKQDFQVDFPFIVIKKKQSKFMHAKDRFLMIENTLSLKENYKLQKNIKYCIFDDVFTTGATLNSAAKLCNENGVLIKNIYVAALLRRDKKGIDSL